MGSCLTPEMNRLRTHALRKRETLLLKDAQVARRRVREPRRTARPLGPQSQVL